MVFQQREQDKGLELLQPEQYNTTVPDNIKTSEASDSSATVSGPLSTDTTPSPPSPIDAVSSVLRQPRIVDPVYQNERQWRRAIMSQLRKRKVEKEVVQKILKIWDLESGVTAQTPEAFDEVSRLLEIDDINWPENCDREALIACIIEYQLEHVLRSYK
jgi:hypothetical protein